jgi:ketosteroid isomerase-like protein
MLLFLRAISIALLLTAATSASQADDRADVLAANQAFEQAFSSRDIQAMEGAWAHDPSVTIVHPISKLPLIGWNAVRTSWEGALSRYADISVTMEDPFAAITSGVAWVIGVEKVRGRRTTGENVEFSVLTTNIYEKRDGRWFMVHHHGSRMPQ